VEKKKISSSRRSLLFNPGRIPLSLPALGFESLIKLQDLFVLHNQDSSKEPARRLSKYFLPCGRNFSFFPSFSYWKSAFFSPHAPSRMTVGSPVERVSRLEEDLALSFSLDETFSLSSSRAFAQDEVSSAKQEAKAFPSDDLFQEVLPFYSLSTFTWTRANLLFVLDWISCEEKHPLFFFLLYLTYFSLSFLS